VPTPDKSVPTSLKLPVQIKQRLDEAARADGLTPHAYMVRVLQQETERRQLREQFQRDALEALREMQTTGLGHEWTDVQTYFAQMAEFRAGRASQPKRLVPKKLA